MPLGSIHPSSIDVHALFLPGLPQRGDARGAGLAAERPDVDVIAADSGIGAIDRLGDSRARRAEVDQQRLLGRRLHHHLRHRDQADVSLVRARDVKRLVEQVQHGHRAAGAALREPRRVLQRVDRRAPHRDAGRLELAVEAVPPVGRVVEEPDDALVEPPGDLGPRVDPAEADLGIRAHLGRLARLRHQAFAEAHHDRVVLGELTREVPEALAHRVGRDGVRVLLHLVEGRLVEVRARAWLAEHLRAERRDRAHHREQALHATVQERQLAREFPRRFAPDPLDLHVVQPQVEAAEDRARVERPLRDDVLLVLLSPRS